MGILVSALGRRRNVATSGFSFHPHTLSEPHGRYHPAERPTPYGSYNNSGTSGLLVRSLKQSLLKVSGGVLLFATDNNRLSSSMHKDLHCGRSRQHLQSLPELWFQ